MKEWFSGMQKERFVLGPHLSPGYGIASETQNREEGKSCDMETFSRGNAGTVWKRFCIYSMQDSYLSSAFQLNKISSDFLWYYRLLSRALSFGICR
jgi:hypothetical protein